MTYGLLNLNFWQLCLVTFAMCEFTIMSVTVYLHRCQSHRALDLHPLASHVFRFWLWLTTGMVTREWVAIHRKHHARTEEVGDPHSPRVFGLKKVLFEGTELYRAEANNEETLAKYSYGTPDDWIERKLYQGHSALGVTIMFVLDVLLFGFPGISIWGIQMMTIPFFAAGVVNGIGHFWGYRNFECPDASRNIVPWGIILCGEELHNNHHAFAHSAKLSSHWWEIDTGWWMIRTLAALRLATVKRVAPKAKAVQVLKQKPCAAAETAQTIIANRFHMMSQYTQQVIIQVLNEERRVAATEKTRACFRHAKQLLVRETSLLTQQAKDRLNELLARNERLQKVYEYKMQLQNIWNKSSANPSDMLEALQQWCKQAEATGIECLKQFATRIRPLLNNSMG